MSADQSSNKNKEKRVPIPSTRQGPSNIKTPNSKIPTNIGKVEFIIPAEVLDDLASRFIINVPEDEQTDIIRLCFQVEQAHWFYLDFFCTKEQSLQLQEPLQQMGIVQFAHQLFKHVPFLQTYSLAAEKIIEQWKVYKQSVPTFGAILLSEDLNKCLLVQSFASKHSWGFPKGKINENEKPVVCAIREVYEETGYDISHKIKVEDFIDATICDQKNRLYIVQDVPVDTIFVPQARNEIRSCTWFNIDALPSRKDDQLVKSRLGLNGNSFFTIIPFVKRLQKWVRNRRKEGNLTCASTNDELSERVSGQVVSFESPLPTSKETQSFNPPNNFNNNFVERMRSIMPHQISNSNDFQSITYDLISTNRNEHPDRDQITSIETKMLRAKCNSDKESSIFAMLDQKHSAAKLLYSLTSVENSGFFIEDKRNGRIMRRATSYEPKIQTEQVENGNHNDQRKQFTVKSNSWTNFKFNQDFLATIFD